MVAKGKAAMAEIDGVGNNGDGGIGSMSEGGGGSYEEVAEEERGRVTSGGYRLGERTGW